MEQRQIFAGKAVIIRNDGHILLLKRAADETHLQEYWDVPGGQVEYGEDPRTALMREVHEEAGIDIDIHAPVDVWRYRHDDGTDRIGVSYCCTPETTDITPGSEHTAHRWVRHNDLDEFTIHSGVRENIYRAHRYWQKHPEIGGKLVRDRIPTIIEENGETPVARTVDDETVLEHLRRKLVEETQEFAEDGDPTELGDVLDVIDAYLDTVDISREQVEQLRAEKTAERGGFTENILLERVD